MARVDLNRSLQRAAHKAVADAIRAGTLARPAEFDCVDCITRRAEHYDHRDYSKPLDVAPVCRACNYKRGPAIGSHAYRAQSALAQPA